MIAVKIKQFGKFTTPPNFTISTQKVCLTRSHYDYWRKHQDQCRPSGFLLRNGCRRCYVLITTTEISPRCYRAACTIMAFPLRLCWQIVGHESATLILYMLKISVGRAWASRPRSHPDPTTLMEILRRLAHDWSAIGHALGHFSIVYKRRLSVNMFKISVGRACSFPT